MTLRRRRKRHAIQHILTYAGIHPVTVFHDCLVGIFKTIFVFLYYTDDPTAATDDDDDRGDVPHYFKFPFEISVPSLK